MTQTIPPLFYGVPAGSQPNGTRRREKRMIKNKYTIVPIVLLLIMTIPFAMADTVTINVDMDGDAYVNVQNNNGTFIIIYNGRDILGELEAAQKSTNDIEKTLIYWHGMTQAGMVNEHLLVVEEQLNNLTRDLNIILAELYNNLGFTMHVVGINPGSSDVAVQLIAGNATIAGYLDGIIITVDDILIDVDIAEKGIISIQTQLENIYTDMMIHDQVITEIRSNLRSVSSELRDVDAHIISDQIHEYEARIVLESRMAEYEMENSVLVEQLEYELFVLNKEFEYQRLVSFGGFGIAIFILLGLFTTIGSKKVVPPVEDEIDTYIDDVLEQQKEREDADDDEVPPEDEPEEPSGDEK